MGKNLKNNLRLLQQLRKQQKRLKRLQQKNKEKTRVAQPPVVLPMGAGSNPSWTNAAVNEQGIDWGTDSGITDAIKFRFTTGTNVSEIRIQTGQRGSTPEQKTDTTLTVYSISRLGLAEMIAGSYRDMDALVNGNEEIIFSGSTALLQNTTYQIDVELWKKHSATGDFKIRVFNPNITPTAVVVVGTPTPPSDVAVLTMGEGSNPSWTNATSDYKTIGTTKSQTTATKFWFTTGTNISEIKIQTDARGSDAKQKIDTTLTVWEVDSNGNTIAISSAWSAWSNSGGRDKDVRKGNGGNEEIIFKVAPTTLDLPALKPNTIYQIDVKLWTTHSATGDFKIRVFNPNITSTPAAPVVVAPKDVPVVEPGFPSLELESIGLPIGFNMTPPFVGSYQLSEPNKYTFTTTTAGKYVIETSRVNTYDKFATVLTLYSDSAFTTKVAESIGEPDPNIKGLGDYVKIDKVDLLAATTYYFTVQAWNYQGGRFGVGVNAAGMQYNLSIRKWVWSAPPSTLITLNQQHTTSIDIGPRTAGKGAGEEFDRKIHEHNTYHFVALKNRQYTIKTVPAPDMWANTYIRFYKTSLNNDITGPVSGGQVSNWVNQVDGAERPEFVSYADDDPEAIQGRDHAKLTTGNLEAGKMYAFEVFAEKFNFESDRSRDLARFGVIVKEALGVFGEDATLADAKKIAFKAVKKSWGDSALHVSLGMSLELKEQVDLRIRSATTIDDIITVMESTMFVKNSSCSS